ncbi:pilus assembly protein TadG-related protein [Geminicoccus roseus]|uniref:pilus assembly protein TadG-related protein n=1 Tax=Geminicoccus roseus TaxID=404900 RepID=UPI00040EE5DC|nr:pilus assembly protein TadG-related protein [Geminicoccus roseus]
MDPSPTPDLACSTSFLAPSGRRLLRTGWGWLQQRWPADRRGATSLIFAVAATAFFGMVALATEAGSWYLVRRNAQNAADASARAGAIALALASPANRTAQINAASIDLAGQNGFTSNAATTISVAHPPSAGPRAGDQASVEVVIRQVQPLMLAELFMESPPTVATRAVASLAGTASACILALDGGLLMGGNSFTSGRDCVLASNASMSRSIEVTGSASVSAYSLHAAGGCSGCNSASVRLTRPYAEYQLPVSNPYAALDTKVLSPTCLGSPPSTGQITPTGLTRAYCSSVSLNGNKTLDFAPGTYVFRNASLDFGGGTITCSACTGDSGVTIIFTGDPALIGGIHINAQAAVTLRAPRVNPDDRDFNGVLFFRDPRATSNNSGNPSIRINGGADSRLEGAMYFPKSYVKFNGNSSVAGSTCTALIGGTLDFTGTADTYVEVSGCAALGAGIPRAQVVRLVE